MLEKTMYPQDGKNKAPQVKQHAENNKENDIKKKSEPKPFSK